MSEKRETGIRVTIGNFLFKYRTYTPMPLILVIFIWGVPAGSEFGVPELAAMVVAIMGELIRVFAVGYSYEGTSGRETYLRAESLNDTGIYSLVRNPLYIGNMLIYIGVMMFFGDSFMLMLCTALLTIQYYFIIGAEENFLKGIYGDVYGEYCSRVNPVLPLSRYVTPSHRFSRIKVLIKENDSVFNAIAMFVIIAIVRTDAENSARLYAYITGGTVFLIYAYIKIFRPWKKS